MASPRRSLIVSDLRGGRNGADPPDSLPDNQAVEMLNVDNYTGLLANKRGGATLLTETGGTAFSGGVKSLFRFVPAASEAAAELWGIDGVATPLVKRMAGSTSFADVTLSDAIANRPQDATAATLNGKLFLAYDSTVDYLHVWDPNLATPRVRRVGFATPAAIAAPTNTGAGAYAAILRYYRVRWLQLTGTTTWRRSEPGTSVGFTPSGTGTGVIVAQPAVPSEQETHWEIEVSLDNSTFYRLSQTVIATTTYTDSAVTTTYSTNTLSAITGAYTKWTSVKYLLTDGNRLLGAGAHEAGGKNSRVWFTPVLGATDQGDDERVPNTTEQQNWVDLNENDGGAITGMGGPVYGAPYVFKYRQIWKLNPTGDVTVPYQPRKLIDGYGTVNHKSIISAKDSYGNPALYFLSPEGPCRIVIQGVQGGSATVQYLGRDIEDIWATINLAATTVLSHGIYHNDKHQVWWWVAVDGAANPTVKIVFDVLLGRFVEGDRIRGGWYKHDGKSAAAACSLMMSNTLGATMSQDLKPYIGQTDASAIWKCDTTALDDAGTAFQAYAKTKPLRLGLFGQNVAIGQSVLLAKAATGVTITQTLDRNYGLETRTSTVSLTADGSESRVIKKFEASDLAQAAAVQVQLGDSAAVATAQWALDALEVPVFQQENL